ncbi:MAG: hypothetical protein GXP26_13775 [Planctomycetes bacterium]|nr:hypothetical protein [Planctomycetota bacterium]
MPHVSANSVLDQFLAPIFTPEVAQQIVTHRPDDKTQARLDELREKANEGRLSDSERQEYQEVVENLDLISLLRAKARAVLANTKRTNQDLP